MIPCQNEDCDGYVSRRFALVFGDDNNDVHACFDCTGKKQIKRGAASGLDPRPLTSHTPLGTARNTTQ